MPLLQIVKKNLIFVPLIQAPFILSFSNEARIQFRLPDGSSTNHVFPADATLDEARRFVKDVGFFFFYFYLMDLL